MIKAQHNNFYIHFFHWYISMIMKRHFHAVKYVDCGLKKINAAVLGIGNHFSWWDGFWMMKLNRRLCKHKFHILMLDEQLKSRMFLNKIGAAGITKSSKDILKMIDYSAHLLHDNNNSLYFFPEGEIRPQNQSELKFEKGIMRIIQKSPDDLHVVFIVNLTEYFTNKKPTLYTYYKSCDAKTFKTITEMEKAYNGFYLECKLRLNNEIT